MQILERILTMRPSFHAGETEIKRAFDTSESFLQPSEAEQLKMSALTCYGIGEDVLRFISEHVKPGTRSLETGAGCSTLVFALQKAQHIAVTPSEVEVSLIRAFCSENTIDLSGVTFMPKTSEDYLPHCEPSALDFVLLDGKHAFPWPMLDWFFTADRLVKGGVMLLDDVQMRSVAVLGEFMAVDPAWKLVRDFSGKTLAFEKIRDRCLDVAWHMQPWNATPPSRFKNALRKLRSKLYLS